MRLKLLWKGFLKRCNSVACLLVCGQMLIVMALSAQNSQTEPDNLRIITPVPTLPDTNAVNQALKKAYTFRETSLQDAGALYRQTLQSSRGLNYKHGIAQSLAGLGRYYNMTNEQDKAVNMLLQSLAYLPDNEEGRDQMVKTYISLSETYYYLGRYDSCATWRYKALRLVESNKISSPLLQVGVLGKMLTFWVNAHEDIQHDKYVLHLIQRIDKLGLEAELRKDSAVLMNVAFQKSGYYHNTGQHDSAIYYSLQTIDYVHKLKEKPSLQIASYLNIGISYIDQKKAAEALIYIHKGMDEIPLQGKELNKQMIFAQMLEGQAYGLLHDYAAAISIAETAVEKAKDQRIQAALDIGYKTLAEAYEATGNYKKAAEHSKLYAEVRDSLMKISKLEAIYDMEMKYQIADKDKELAQKELDIIRNESRIKSKNFWIGGISAGLLLISLLTFLLYRNNRHKQKLQAENIRNLNQQLQISSLRSMIAGEERERSRIARELHDGMGGMLGTIRLRVSSIFRKHKTTDVTSDFEEVMGLLEEASADLRKTAHNLMPEILLQEGLMKASALFCERVSKGHSLDIHFETWGEIRQLPPDFELTAYRIIQELVHNIQKHARATEATVQIVYHETQVCLTVEDNGLGMPEGSVQETGGGMGLRTIRERVNALNGQMDIASTPGTGTSIYIELTVSAVKQNTPE